MNKKPGFIRWWGLIPFVVVTGLIAGFLLLFLDSLIESTIEEQGSQALGAQVDVASVKTSLLDHSIEIRGIEIANAEKLDENIIEVGNFTFNFDLNQAFSKKLIIDELTADGIAFNTTRKTPARPVKKPAKKKETPEEEEADDSSSGPGFGGLDALKGMQFKSPKEILESEKLETLERVKEVREDVKATKAKWEDRIQNRYGKGAIDEIKQKIDGIKQRAKKISGPGDVQALTADIQSLRGDIEGRVDEIKNLKSELKAETEKAQALVRDLKDLPRKDLERLKSKYSLDLKGGTGMVGALVAGPLKDHLNKARRYYEKAKPYLKKKKEPVVPEPETPERGKGLTIEFLKPKPTPDFLVRHGKLSITLFGQDVSGDLKDLSDNQKIHGKPMVVKFDAGNNPKFDRFNLDLTVDRTGTAGRDTLKTRIEGLKLSGFETGKAVKVEQGGADIKSTFNIVSEEALTGNINVQTRDMNMKWTQSGSGELADIMQKTLNSVSRFYLNFLVSGTVNDYAVKVESDLDKTLNRAIRGVFDDKVKEFEGKLNAAILEKTKGPLKDSTGAVSNLVDLRKLLDSRESSLQNLLGEATQKALLPKLPGPAGDLLKQFKLPF
ncbi:hypothetical protein NITGR_280114 [Nitrospina gracilis 3/211]|uniref:TIGR03545 family protein n=1 Tax=Nitrospina gracilis (strain 3/211) TaxID=1266370 RepID=M1YIS4_NITG3|nr:MULTISPECIES: TIGR03545 family protein [Nitrospina]MCF8723345.1 uncharacterized protein (TIGR03545 family) [Nitrospina sp. Nb-3]CCQ90398.1 hypothetical protein NITGR_280114 [Nitrospina gracilis 3/211]